MTANKQLVARHGAELFEAAAAGGVQLRFEASVCAAIPVIKVLRESLVVTNVHQVLGIVNGTTNFILSAMEEGRSLRRRARRGAAARLRRGGPDRGRRRPRRRGEDGDPRDGRVRLARPDRVGRGRGDRARHARPRRGGARARDAREADRPRQPRRRPRRRPRRPGVRRRPPSARRGRGRVQRRHAPGRRDPRDHARGPGRRRASRRRRPSSPTWSPSSARPGTGFLQNDPVWRSLEQLPPGDLASPFYLRLEVEDRAGVLARIAQELAAEEVSVAQLVQQPGDGHAVLHIVTHEAPGGQRRERARRDPRAARGEGRGERDARDLGPRRGGARLGMTVAADRDAFRIAVPAGRPTRRR